MSSHCDFSGLTQRKKPEQRGAPAYCGKRQFSLYRFLVFRLRTSGA